MPKNDETDDEMTRERYDDTKPQIDNLIIDIAKMKEEKKGMEEKIKEYDILLKEKEDEIRFIDKSNELMKRYRGSIVSGMLKKVIEIDKLYETVKNFYPFPVIKCKECGSTRIYSKTDKVLKDGEKVLCKNCEKDVDYIGTEPEKKPSFFREDNIFDLFIDKFEKIDIINMNEYVEDMINLEKMYIDSLRKDYEENWKTNEDICIENFIEICRRIRKRQMHEIMIDILSVFRDFRKTVEKTIKDDIKKEKRLVKKTVSKDKRDKKKC